MTEFRLFLTAIQYFTRVPVPAWVGHSPEQLNAAARWFPAVGLLVGAVAAAVHTVATGASTPLLGVALALTATALVTGAFHEDGLADTADGLGGSADRDRALTIMKDSRLGTYGVLALMLVTLVKAAALLANPSHIAAAFIAGHASSRWLAVTVIARQRYVRESDDARGKPLSHAIAPGGLAFATACGLAPSLLVGAPALAGLAAATAARIWLGAIYRRRLGGYTGDCLGAVQQVSEAAYYVGVACALGGGASTFAAWW